MVKIRDYEIKNNVSEFTVEEFEKISAILNDEDLDKFERWADMFIYLGVPVEDVNDMEFKEFVEHVKTFNDTKVDTESKMVQEIEVEGYTYRSYEDEFKLKVKDLKLIEKAIKKNANDYFPYLLAVIYKRTDLTNTEHYTEAHLKHKAKLFKNLNASIAVPFIIHVAQMLNTNESTEVVE